MCPTRVARGPRTAPGTGVAQRQPTFKFKTISATGIKKHNIHTNWERFVAIAWIYKVGVERARLKHPP